MKVVEWKNRDEWKGNDDDPAWAVELGPVCLKVNKHIHYEPDQWVIHTAPEIFRMRPATSSDVEEAKKEAVELLKVFMNSTLEGIQHLEETQ